MPIGIGAAVLGSAAIAGGATLAASKSNSKAVKNASNVQAQSAADQNALQRDIYGKNQAALSPFMQRGNAAGDQINALLGLGGPAQASVSPQGGQGLPTQQPFQAAPFDAIGNAALGQSKPWLMQGGGGFMPTQPTAQAAGQQPGQSPAAAATNAYEIFKQSAGYQTRLDEGNRSLASNYFGGGVGQSGAAMKAALKYGQNFASNEFGNYLGQLGNQQGVGFAGASALAGVGQNYANNMGNISQNNANMQSQAAIANAQNRGALYTGLAGIAGNAAGTLSSYRQPQYNYGALMPSVNQAFAENPGIF